MKIGRRRRALARSTMPRPMIGSALAVHDTTMSNFRRGSRAARSAQRAAIDAPKRCELFAALDGAVGHHDGASGCCARSAWRTVRSSRRRRRTAPGSRAGPRRCAGPAALPAAAIDTECAPISVVERTSLATANERWNSWCRCVPSEPASCATRDRFLHLAEDLRFAQHHRVQAGGDAEGVAHGLTVGQHVQMRVELPRGKPLAMCQPPGQRRGHLTRLLGGAIDFGAVAGRQDRPFGHQRAQAAAHVGQRFAQPLPRKGNTLAHRDRRGGVIQS
jgi:hypothetical protein